MKATCAMTGQVCFNVKIHISMHSVNSVLLLTVGMGQTPDHHFEVDQGLLVSTGQGLKKMLSNTVYYML